MNDSHTQAVHAAAMVAMTSPGIPQVSPDRLQQWAFDIGPSASIESRPDECGVEYDVLLLNGHMVAWAAKAEVQS